MLRMEPPSKREKERPKRMFMDVEEDMTAVGMTER